MIYQITGQVSQIFDNQIVLILNKIGYEIYVSNPKKFSIGKELTLFTHVLKKEDEDVMIGFKKIEEKKLFLQFVNLKGVGYKTALNLLNVDSLDELTNAIKCENYNYLLKINGIGLKTAQFIVSKLKKKIKNCKQDVNQNIIIALRNLGFSNIKINYVLNNLDTEGKSDSELLKSALGLLNDNYEK